LKGRGFKPRRKFCKIKSGFSRRDVAGDMCTASSFLSNETDFILTSDLSSSYLIIRHNVRTYRSDGVIVVIKGKHNAELQLKNIEESQDSSDRHEGWRYFIEKTDLKAGTDPAEATQHRQDELEARELKALQETEPPSFSPPPRKR
jgi:hypothetical protein